MTTTPGMRYRGAQPFSDDELSRRTFFGRTEAAESLTNQILANRLVVVYAKSGVGKSSLLNAGVAPRLREAGYQPLLIRLNDIGVGPTASVFEGVRSEAARQQTEYGHGDTASLWAFFKTVEFWRGDRLLTPVLVIDQFEELFTLHSESARDAFLTELSYVVRGVPPPSPDPATAALGDSAPPIHVVLSLREDFLGILEDGADRIPQIMDHRFRLVPLSRQAAAEAMAGPARLADAALSTKPFTLAPEFTETVLDYLTKRVSGTTDATKRFVEPFHLQLICQRVEQEIATRVQKPKARALPPDHAFTLADFGGEAALSYTLATFYANAIRSISEPLLRPAAKRLCEEFLISPEGRRLSIEEHELRKQLRLSERALVQLVESRLLRTDRRSDSIYYELSHDALVEPVLATRRTQALLLGWSAIVFGSLGVLITALLILYALAFLFIPGVNTDHTEPIAPIFVLVSATGLLFVARQVWKAGWRAHRRFRPRRAQADEPAMPVFVRTRDKVLGWTVTGLGFLIVGFFVLVGLVVAAGVASIFAHGGVIPAWVNAGENPFWNNVYRRPAPELFWLGLSFTVIVLFGAMLFRSGWRRLYPVAPARRAQTVSRSLSSHWLSRFDARPLRLAASVLGIALVATGVYMLQHCATVSQGSLPAWMSPSVLSSDLPLACKKSYEGDWESGDLWSLVLVMACALWVSIPGVLTLFRAAYRRLGPVRAGA